MLKAGLQLLSGTEGKVLTYFGRRSLLLVHIRAAKLAAGVLGLAPGFCVRATAWR